jgi:hypothetical protein
MLAYQYSDLQIQIKLMNLIDKWIFVTGPGWTKLVDEAKRRFGQNNN